MVGQNCVWLIHCRRLAQKYLKVQGNVFVSLPGATTQHFTARHTDEKGIVLQNASGYHFVATAN